MNDNMITVKDVEYKIGEFFLNTINLSIRQGEYFVILGPSGNGKTVLLRCIAGLNNIDRGEVWIDGKQNVIDRSFVAYIPAGTKHGPITINRIDKPIFHFTAGMAVHYR